MSKRLRLLGPVYPNWFIDEPCVTPTEVLYW